MTPFVIVTMGANESIRLTRSGRDVPAYSSRSGWIEPPVSKSNRLVGYEKTDDATSDVLLRVVYEYHRDGEGAGNVSQIRRMTPTRQPDEYTVVPRE